MKSRPANFVLRDSSEGRVRALVTGKRYRCLPMTMTLASAERSAVEASAQRFCRLVGLWLAVKKIIHHDDVVLITVIRSRGYVARRDPDPRDARVFKKDPEE